MSKQNEEFAERILSLDIKDFVSQQSFIKARCLAKESKKEQEQDWPYSYDKASSAEGGPVSPQADPNCATLFIFPLSIYTVNIYDSIDAVPQEILSLLHIPMKILSSGGWKYIIIPHNTQEWENLPFPPNHILYHSYAFTMAKQEHSKQDRPIIQGSVNLKPAYDVSGDILSQLKNQVTINTPTQKSFTGPVIIMRSSCPAGTQALSILKNQLKPTEYAWIPHVSTTTELNSLSLQFQIETGTGCIPTLPFGRGTFLHRNLSTLFKLHCKNSNETIGKCLVSYYCANFDEQGPTIEMISIKRKFRGKGYCLLFYKLIEQYILKSWSACGKLVNGILQQRIMVTSQPGSQIELNIRNDEYISITDRVLFSQYLGYDEHVTQNIQKNIPGQDQVKYFPLETVSDIVSDDFILSPFMHKNYGRQPCYYCRTLSSRERDYKRCAACKIAHYCSQKCQSEDWPDHQLWCQKSRDEIDNMYFDNLQ